MNNEDLFDKYLSNTMTAGEEQELYDLLKDDEISQQLVEYSLEIFTNVKTANDLLKGNTSKQRNDILKQHQQAFPIKKYLTVALSVAAMLVSGLWLSRPVLIADAEISKIGEKANIVHGGKFRPGDKIKTTKPTHFEFMDGSKIKLFGEVVVQNEKQIYLKSGYITINAVHQIGGALYVITDNAKAEVLGTSFTLRNNDNETALEVSEGKVLFSHKEHSETFSAGFAAVTFNGKIVSSQKGLKHVNHLIYSSILTSDSTLKLFTPMENTDPLKAIGFPPSSCKLVSGSFVKGKNQFTRALKNGILEIQGSENFDMAVPCSIGVWVKIRDFENYPPILTKGDDSWRVQMNVNGKRFHIGFGDNKQFINSKKFVELDKWYFMTFVASKDSVKVYVNGELENEKAFDSYSFKNDSTIMIGGNKTVPERNFAGLIGNAFILRRELSPSEVNSLYNRYK
ncbi:MAG: FecR domain-containing protein [Lentisphaeraceae bacterium]|nr:FecR domain-containing protein [Lentisphaeraceae bacterium]